MIKKELLTQEDCIQTGYQMPISGRVIILRYSSMLGKQRNATHQLYYCTGGFGSNPNPSGRAVFTISLADGERIRWNRSDILGIAKPEVLTDHARFQLSQIRPFDALDIKGHEPEFRGNCFLLDGSYTSSVWLGSVKEEQDYIEIQKDYQYRITVCTKDDFCIFEMLDGKVIQPLSEAKQKK